MKKSKIILILLLIFSLVSLASAHNPFTTKPENQHAALKPAFKSKLFVKIIAWQHQLKEKMTSLLRQAKAADSMRPLFFLIMAAFTYGVIHATGPGHGKAIALSYVLSQRPKYIQGILFGSSIALFHGASGIIFVLFIRIVLNTSIVNNLECVTHITQIISYSIIACFGLGIFVNGIYKLIKNNDENQRRFDNKQTRQYVNPILSAFVVGSIPCPGVVMVMLFALSMDLITLGIILGVTISIGMALTISILVTIAMSGKAAALTIVTQKGKLAILVEYWIEIFAGAALATLGLLFLGANI